MNTEHVKTTKLPIINPSKASPFSSLPVEVSLHILSFLTDDNLRSLALTSRALNNLSSSSFLSQNDIVEGYFWLNIHQGLDPPDAFTFLKISPWLRSQVKSLDCEYPSQDTITGLRSFTELLANLRQPFNLNLEWYEGPRAADDGFLREWSETVGDMLNTAVKAGCQKLDLCRGDTMAETFLFRRYNEDLEGALHGHTSPSLEYPSGMQGAGWQFYRNEVQGKVPYVVLPTHLTPGESGLQKLFIHSPTLLMPPCLPWTLSIIHISHITELSLANVNLQQDIWEVVLPLFENTAHITSLSIIDCDDIPPAVLMTFLARCPHLTRLRLKFDNDSRPSLINASHDDTRRPCLTFKNLAILDASLPWCELIIAPPQQPDSPSPSASFPPFAFGDSDQMGHDKLEAQRFPRLQNVVTYPQNADLGEITVSLGRIAKGLFPSPRLSATPSRGVTTDLSISRVGGDCQTQSGGGEKPPPPPPPPPPPDSDGKSLPPNPLLLRFRLDMRECPIPSSSALAAHLKSVRRGGDGGDDGGGVEGTGTNVMLDGLACVTDLELSLGNSTTLVSSYSGSGSGSDSYSSAWRGDLPEIDKSLGLFVDWLSMWGGLKSLEIKIVQSGYGQNMEMKMDEATVLKRIVEMMKAREEMNGIEGVALGGETWGEGIW